MFQTPPLTLIPLDEDNRLTEHQPKKGVYRRLGAAVVQGSQPDSRPAVVDAAKKVTTTFSCFSLSGEHALPRGGPDRR